MKVELTEQMDQIHRFILETFIKTGNSPTHQDIAEKFSLSDENKAELLLSELEKSRAIHRDPGDEYVTYAYPFSNKPTSHKVRLSTGVEVYSMCAVDALGIPLMVRVDAEIYSECHHCQTLTKVTVVNGEIENFEPSSIVVGYRLAGDGCISAVDLCPNINFFCSPDHLRDWNDANPERAAEELTLDQAFESGRFNFEELLYRK